MKASTSKTTYGEICSSNIGLTSSVLPKAKSSLSDKSSQVGVYTKNAFSRRFPEIKTTKYKVTHRHSIRCTYGLNEHVASLRKEGDNAFFSVISTPCPINGNIKDIKELSIPNILFVYGAFEQLKVYVYKNNQLDTKYLRFHYNQKHDVEKESLIIPDEQIDSLIKTCAITAEDKLIDPYVVEKFKKGKLVKVTEGPYKGVEGVVGRYKGQQRIGIVVEDLFTVTTSYVPKDFINYEEDFY